MIGGNIKAILQVKSMSGTNEIGQKVRGWQDYMIVMPGREEPGLYGFLDLVSGDSKNKPFNAKIQESTHIFISDYVELELTSENSRMIVNNEIYEIVLIDNPMGLNIQLEIYLKYTGGQ